MKTESQSSLPDIELQQAILAELAWEPVINAAHIGVTVRHGVVTIKGTVESFTEKIKVKRAVLRLQGVQAFTDDLRVKLPERNSRSDNDLARAVSHALEWDTLIHTSNFK